MTTRLLLVPFTAGGASESVSLNGALSGGADVNEAASLASTVNVGIPAGCAEAL